MSDAGGANDTEPMLTAGAMLRAARQAQGMHVAVLATQLKVTPRKLEALEADRHDELQGPTFVRALAQAASRALRVDPGPILARLPAVEQHTLDQVTGGLNAPFREHGLRRDPLELSGATRGVLAIVVLLLLAAAALWFLPQGWRLPLLTSTSAESADAGAATPGTGTPLPTTASAAALLPATVPAAATVSKTPASESHPAAVEPGQLLRVRATAESWVDVTDAAGQSLLSRTLQPGETVDLDGVLPLRVKIGNASGTELNFRGQPLDLSTSTRDNIARLELK